MPSEDLIVGLDVGTTKVTAMAAEYDEAGRIRVVGVGSSPSNGLRRGVVINIESTLKAVAAAVEEAEHMSGHEVYDVYTGIAGGNVEGFNSRGVVAVSGKDREISPADVDRVIEAARAVVIPMDREILHVIPQEFIVDGQPGVRNPLDMIGVRLESEVHMITGTGSSVQNLIKCINRGGLRVNDIVLESIAASDAVLTEDEKELGVLHIDLGGGTTDILVYRQGAPHYTSVISIGSAQVTSDLSILLKAPVEAAEKIKLNDGCCWEPMVDPSEEVIIPGVGGRPPLARPRRDVAEIAQARMGEIFGMVKRQVSKNGYLDQLVSGLVITGGGALMPGVPELAADVFGMPARVGVPRISGEIEEKYQRADYATVIGLVRHGAVKKSRPEALGGSSGQKRNSRMEGLKKWLRNFF